MSKHLKATARGLAALGRGPDTMLVHMAPGEVAGLQKLAVATGGTLTVNPHTGLLEAGWLSTLLPMVAAGAATVFSGGTLAPLVAAAWGAGGGALGAKIEGEDPLAGAAFGALGGLGGSGIAGGLMNAGRAGQVAAGTGTVLKDAGTAAAQNAVQGTGNFAQAAAQNLQSPALNTIANAQQAGLPAVSTMAPTEAFKAGVGSLANKGVPSQIWGGMSPGAKLGTTATGIAALDQASQSSSSSGSGKKNKPLYYMSQPTTVDPVTGETTFGSGYWSKDYDYGNHGMFDPQGIIPDAPTYKKHEDAYKAASGGRYVDGAGDGVSDSIPAKIDGKQEAALARNEFVIPARHVSELGNGSSDAGAERLYAMLHRIEQRRQKTPYAEDSGASQELPA